MLHLPGGLDKLADIVSPIAESMPAQEVAANALQRSLKGVQAALESRQAAIFGEQVSCKSTSGMYLTQPAYTCAPVPPPPPATIMVPWARLPALHVVATFLQGWARYSCNHVYGCMAYFLIAVDRQDTMSVMTLQAMSSGGRMTQIPLTVNAMCPSHGPVVQASLTELLRSYQYVPEPCFQGAIHNMH